MKISLLLSVAGLSMAASAPQDGPVQSDPQSEMRVFGTQAPDTQACDDLITQARDDVGAPKLDRQPATADKPYLIAAVDQKIDGCSVMVMHHDKTDFRPLPSPPAGPPLLEPAD